MRPGRLIACMLTLLCGAPVHAAEQSVPLDISMLLAEFAKTSSATTRFEETRRLAGTKEATQSRGILRYTAPDRLERETEYPNRERSFVNGHLLTLERTVEGKLVRRSLPLDQLPTLNTFFTALRATLSGNQRALAELFSINLTGEVSAWTMTLKPLDGAGPSGVRQIRLAGESAAIRRIEVDEASGDSVSTTLTPISPPPSSPEPAIEPAESRVPG